MLDLVCHFMNNYNNSQKTLVKIVLRRIFKTIPVGLTGCFKINGHLYELNAPTQVLVKDFTARFWIFFFFCSVLSDFLQPHGLQPSWLLWPWDPPEKNTRVGSHCLFQGIFPTQGSSPGLLHCRWFLTIWATREAQSLEYSENKDTGKAEFD